ncbi:hypothetical protein JTB14_006753 [Gonioctena quinquepunctata]|nr:hypothetical protein JTB14_006753 [Gonioctena quinquepunctata]
MDQCSPLNKPMSATQSTQNRRLVRLVIPNDPAPASKVKITNEFTVLLSANENLGISELVTFGRCPRIQVNEKASRNALAREFHMQLKLQAVLSQTNKVMLYKTILVYRQLRLGTSKSDKPAHPDVEDHKNYLIREAVDYRI